MNTSTTPIATPPNTAERCDRCGARAMVRTMFLVGEDLCDLLWCGHHFTAYETAIRTHAILVHL